MNYNKLLYRETYSRTISKGVLQTPDPSGEVLGVGTGWEVEIVSDGDGGKTGRGSYHIVSSTN